MARTIKKEILQKRVAFEGLKTQVARKLEKLEVREVDDVTLALIDSEDFLFFKGIEALALQLQGSPHQKREFGVRKLFNLLNFDNTPAIYYHLIHNVHRYEHVTDQEKVLARLKQAYEIDKNKRTLELEKRFSEDKSLTQKRKQELQEQLAKDLSYAKEEMQKLLDNPKEYKIIYSDFKEFRTYVGIDLRFSTNKIVRNRTLRKGVANLLWYEDQSVKKYHGSVSRFINDAKTKNPFSYIYYQEVGE